MIKIAKILTYVVLVSMTLSGTAIAKKGGTNWLPVSEFKAYVAEKEKKNVWGRYNWITSVQGRYKDGQVEYRLRYESAPSDGGFKWRWCYGLKEDQFRKRKKEAKKMAVPLVHEQSFTLPSGEKLYQAVWQYQD